MNSDRLNHLTEAIGYLYEAKQAFAKAKESSFEASCQELRDEVSTEIRHERQRIESAARIERLTDETPVRYVAPDEARDADELWCRAL